jgi:hypothetical protein
MLTIIYVSLSDDSSVCAVPMVGHSAGSGLCSVGSLFIIIVCSLFPFFIFQQFYSVHTTTTDDFLKCSFIILQLFVGKIGQQTSQLQGTSHAERGWRVSRMILILFSFYDHDLISCDFALLFIYKQCPVTFASSLS